MKSTLKYVAAFLVSAGSISQLPLHSQANPLPAPSASAAARDGSHDFDFELGTWKTHLRVLTHPGGGEGKWADYHGTSVVHSIWNGRANLVELQVDGPTGHVDALSLRLYNPDAHQWSLNSANPSQGTISVPTVGSFTNGRGEFYDFEPIRGKMTLVRNLWSGITPTACHFEQAFSEDGGKTWETNWIADDTRDAAPAGKAASW